MTAEALPPIKTLEERKALLAQQIAIEVTQGARIESQTETVAVIVRGQKVNHILHFLIGFPTLGIWWLTGWPILAITGGEKRSVIIIDEFGNILKQKQKQ